MTSNLYLPDNLEKKLDEYRRQHKALTGKMITRQRAMCDILEKFLDEFLTGISPVQSIEERVAKLEETVKKMESERK